MQLQCIAHAILAISWWLDELPPDLPPDFSLEAVKYTTKVIMINNMFEWGSLYFLTLIRPAVGTSAAVIWDTLYFR